MKQRIRIKDIAERTGVSIGTVDRVIHNRGHVSSEAREKIVQVMMEMGYEPNIIARTLASNKTLQIAAILPDYRMDPYWVQPKEGVENARTAVGHYGVSVHFFFFNIFDPEDYTRQIGLALESAPDAILFAPVFLKESLPLIEATTARNIPTVMINTYIESTTVLSYIGQDSYQSGVLAGRLLNFGLNDGDQAAVLNLDKSVTNARHLLDKVRGFKDYFATVKDKNIGIYSEAIENFDEPGKLRQRMLELFAHYPRLKAVFITNSRAYRLVDALEPDELARIRIVGYDLIEPNLRYLESGKISFLINQNAWYQGYLGLMSIVKKLILKKDLNPLQYLPLDIVVKENVEYYLNRTLELPL